jgi:flagellar assembly protein FliH
MPAVEKYLFDTSFDAPPPAPPPVVEEPVEIVPEEPPPPTFSEAELAAAREQAYAEGLAEGLKRARAEAAESQTQKLNDLLAVLSGKVATLLTEEAARVAQSREMTMQIALAIARKLLPDYANRNGLGEIEAAVLHVLSGLGGEPRVVIRVADGLLDTVTLKVQQEAARYGFGGKLVFIGDAGLGPSDCRVEWADGGLERDTMRIWSEVDRLVAEVLRGQYAPRPDGTTD